MSRSWLLYLDDLIAAAAKIDRLTHGRDVEQLAGDEAAFDAVLFNLQVIGEAIKRLPPKATSQLSEAHRSGPARLRDLIAHHYFAIDPELIWEVATRHVPALLAQAQQVQGATDPQSGEAPIRKPD